MELVTTYEEEELRGSAVTFASSPSDSDDEEFEIEGAHGGTPPRPTLRYTHHIIGRKEGRRV